MYKMYTIYNMKTFTASEMRTKFKEAYNHVRFSGEPITITHHGDDSVVLVRKADIYPEPTTTDLSRMAAISGAFDDVINDAVTYE